VISLLAGAQPTSQGAAGKRNLPGRRLPGATHRQRNAGARIVLDVAFPIVINSSPIGEGPLLTLLRCHLALRSVSTFNSSVGQKSSWCWQSPCISVARGMVRLLN